MMDRLSANGLTGRTSYNSISCDNAASYFKAINCLNARFDAFVNIFLDESGIDMQVDDAGARPLAGMPVAIKDVIDIEGVPTIANCRALADHRAKEDAVVIQRLKAAGALIVGKAATWELAIGEPDRDTPYAVPKNPWSSDHATGGSSSGSAVAVAAGMCPAALGTDTGGSIRSPASWCGVVGFKPSFGVVSNQGVLPLASSFDHVGPIANSVYDAARIFDVIRDQQPTGSAGAIRKLLSRQELKGIRIGVWRQAFEEANPADPEVAEVFAEGVHLLRDLGAAVDDIRLPPLAQYNATFYLAARHEGYRHHHDLLASRRSGIGLKARERLLTGGLLSDKDVQHAQALRDILKAATAAAMTNFDLIVMPTMPTTAPSNSNPGAAMRLDTPQYVRAASCTGQPSITVPCGVSRQGLPIGLMMTGRWGEDDLVLAAAHVFEKSLPVQTRSPVFELQSAHAPLGASGALVETSP